MKKNKGYYEAKAIEALKKMGAKDADPEELTMWGMDAQPGQVALITVDGKVVGQAEYIKSHDFSVAYIDQATADKYGIQKLQLSLATGSISGILGEDVCVVKQWAFTGAAVRVTK